MFDGARDRPYVETDTVAPLNVYGRSKAEAEAARAGRRTRRALVVRTSAFFGPWDKYNFVTAGAARAGRGRAVPRAATTWPCRRPTCRTSSNACLDLRDRRRARRLAPVQRGTLTWAELAGRAAAQAGVDASRLEAVPAASCGFTARRPRYTGLHSARGILLPALDNALARYLDLRNEIDHEMEELILMAESRQA